MKFFSLSVSQGATLTTSTASGLGQNSFGWGPQYQEPQSADFNGCMSVEGSGQMGCYRHPHPEQLARLVLAAQVRPKKKPELGLLSVKPMACDQYSKVLTLIWKFDGGNKQTLSQNI